MKNNLFVIAQSGWKYIAYAFVAFLFFGLLDFDFFSFASFIFLVGFLFLFRNPEREIPLFQEASLVVPSDGKVVAIENIEDTQYAYRIDIESSYKDVSVLRAPMSATVEEVSVVRGTRVAKYSQLFADLNEYAKVTFIDKGQNRVQLLHRLKQGCLPLNIDLASGQEVVQTTRYGLMINGITSIYLKENFRINLHVGEEVRASQTLVGYFS